VKALDANVLPVENVSWHEAVEFCEKLSESTRGEPRGIYRLPTEAEWEYACRAGGTTEYSFGDEPNALTGFGWVGSGSGGRTHVGGELEANPFGLYDMHGNVAEWCHDRFGREYYGATPSRDPTGPQVGLHRVTRGGAWNGSAFSARSSARGHEDPFYKDSSTGFRIVRAEPLAGVD
jgi:formylglycine-generating enzyme required for sulfatase activity